MAYTGKGLPRSLAGVKLSTDTTAIENDVSRLQSDSLSPRPVLSGVQTGLAKAAVGMATVTITSGGTGYAVGDILKISGGTSTFGATVKVTTVNAGVITGVTINEPGIYTTAPTAPFASTGGTGSGATFGGTFNASNAYSVANRIVIANNDPAIEYLGYNPKEVTYGYVGNGVQNGTQMCIQFDSDAPRIDFLLVGLNSQYDLYVDGYRVSNAPVATDSSGGAYRYTVDWNGESKVRRYRLCGINTAFGGLYIGSPYSIMPPVGLRKPLAWQMGDSYTVGVGATQPSYNDFRVMCDLLGLEGIADGISGAGWTSTQDGRVPEWRVRNKLAVLTKTPDYVFLAMGYNDGGADVSRIQAAFTAAVQAVREVTPKAKIIVIGAATPKGATAGLDAVRGTIKQLSDDLGLEYVDMRDIVNSTNSTVYTSPDNIHPTNAGHIFRGTMMGRLVSDKLERA